MQEENTTQSIFSFQLKKLMKEKSLTQVRLSDSLGVTQAAVSRWLNGSIPKGEQLMKLCRYLDVTQNYLFGDEGAFEKLSDQVREENNRTYTTKKASGLAVTTPLYPKPPTIEDRLAIIESQLNVLISEVRNAQKSEFRSSEKPRITYPKGNE